MCGICGLARTKNGAPITPHLLSRMRKSLSHRGPDDEGVFLDGIVGLGVCRLSVIDIEGGRQPQPNEDRSVWIVHNGEVYNYPALRQELKSLEHSFSTRSDTEAIVHSYEEWGEDGVQRLRGMYAFALRDKRLEKLVLVRDRLGIKPLYYTLLEDKTLVFASELKAVLLHPEVKRVLNHEALDLFLTLEYIPAPHTIFKNIFKLPPGCLLVYDNGQVEIKTYWSLESQPIHQKSDLNPENLKQRLRTLLEDSVRLRLQSDVPLGAFLSGGLMKELGCSPLRTFSVGFEDASYNELEHARRVAQKFQTDHQEYILKPNIMDLTQRLIHHLDEPFGDFSIFPTYLVSRMARQQVKVILTGDGSDELFGGYEHYQAQSLSRWPFVSFLGKALGPMAKKIPPAAQKKGVWNKIRRFSQGFEHHPSFRHLRWMMFLSTADKNGLYTPELLRELGGLKGLFDKAPFQSVFDHLSSYDETNAELFIDLKTYLPDDILVKIDRMSLAASLEARVPFLDHRLVEFVFSLPGSLKVKGLTSKWLLKNAMAGILSDKTIHRSKEGFSIPMKAWLRTELKDFLLDTLSEERITREGLFKYAAVKKMIDAHLKGKENYSHPLWSLIVFETWRDRYL
jgi:asparagine synthase (glutamine-hydrolysing)